MLTVYAVKALVLLENVVWLIVANRDLNEN